jgi:hypothetical protein
MQAIRWNSVCFVLVVLLGGCAANVATPITVEFWHGGDHAVSQKLIVAVEAAFRQSPDFRLTPVGTGRRLVVSTSNVESDMVGDRMNVTYVVVFSSLDENTSANPDLQKRLALAKEINTRRGSCWDSELPKYAAQIVHYARIASRNLPH